MGRRRSQSSANRRVGEVKSRSRRYASHSTARSSGVRKESRDHACFLAVKPTPLLATEWRLWRGLRSFTRVPMDARYPPKPEVQTDPLPTRRVIVEGRAYELVESLGYNRDMGARAWIVRDARRRAHRRGPLEGARFWTPHDRVRLSAARSGAVRSDAVHN